jgi:hypothetical protein
MSKNSDLKFMDKTIRGEFLWLAELDELLVFCDVVDHLATS